MTSTRGPYDLFSGDRNKPITVGYLAAPVSTCIIVFNIQTEVDAQKYNV